MKRLTKASKIGLAALLIAITFFALTIFFALYQPEVDSAVNTLENAILKDNSPVENELVAEAAELSKEGSVVVIGSAEASDTSRVPGGGTSNSGSGSVSFNFSDRYKLALKGSGSLKFYASMNITKNDNGGNNQTVSANCGGVNLSRTGTKGVITTNKGNIPKDATSCSVSYEIYTDDGRWGNRKYTKMSNLTLYIEKGDNTAPTINNPSNTQSVNKVSYTTSSSLNITDKLAGLYQINYTYTPIGGSASTYTTTIEGYKTSYTFNFSLGYGEYKINWVTDNLNNKQSSSKTFRYYKADVTLSAVTTGFDLGAVGGTISGKIGSGAADTSFTAQPYNTTITVSVTVNAGYYFAGLKISNGTTSSKIFAPSQTYSYVIPYSNTTSQTITAYFVAFKVTASDATYAYNKEVSASASEVSLDNNNQSPFTNKNGNIDFAISYSGTLEGGGSWDSVPQYAGEYTATAYAKYGDTTVGTTSCSYTINPMTVYAAPVFDSASKTYDGTSTFAISGWRLYSDSARESYIADTSNDLIKVSGPESYSVTRKDRGNYTFGISATGLSLSSASTTYTAAKTGSYKLDTGDITKYYLSGSTGNAASNSSLFIIAKQITPKLFLAEMTANGAKKYTGKVYDNSNDILGNDFVLFIYDGTEAGALAAFEAASPAVGVIGLGLNIKGMVSEETYAFALDGASTGSATLVLTFNASPVYPNYEYIGKEVSAGVARSDITLNSSNYTFSLNLSVTGLTISPRPLTVSLTSVSDKAYDGTSDAEVTYALSGIASGDSITLTGGSASFEDKNAGENKTVTFSGYSVEGDKNYNYYLVNNEVSGTASIRKVKASWSADYLGKVTDEEGKEVRGKLFDGTTAVEPSLLSFEVKDAVNDETFDVLVPKYVASFTSSSAGETTLMITAVSLSGNYEFENESYEIRGLNIVRKSINSKGVTFALDQTEFVYTSSVCAPEIETATDESIATLKIDTDYTVSIPSDSVTVGVYDVYVEGTGNYYGSLTLTYEITRGTFTATLGETAEIVLDYGTILATDEVETYFSSVAASNDASRAIIAGGTWEFVIPSDIYNAKGNTGLYRATHDTPHVIKAVYTLPDIEKPNYESESAEITVSLSVTQGALQITILPETVTFGSTYSLGAVSGTDYTISGFVEGDESNLSDVKFALKDAEGFVADDDTLNDVGTYPNAITLSAYKSYNYNYTVEADFGTLIINPLPVTVAPDPEQFKYYGESDPVFDYTAATVYPLRAGYSIDYSEFTGAVSRTEGEIATNYAFVQGTLASENYSLTFKPDSNTVFSIKVLPVTVKAVNREAYYGTLISSPTEYTVSVDGEYKVDYTFENGVMSFRIGETVMTDALSVSLNTSANDSAAASAYPISVSLATSSGLNNSKNLSISTVDAVYTILKLPVLITPNAIEKTYGSSDPAHTSFNPYYSWAADAADIELRANFNPSFNGNIVRAEGEDVGVYAWEQGTLTSSDTYNSNFVIRFNSNSDNAFTIKPREIRLVADTYKITVGEALPEGLGSYTLHSSSSLYDADWSYSGIKPTLADAVSGKLIIVDPVYNDDGLLQVKRNDLNAVVGYDLTPDETLSGYFFPDALPDGYNRNYYVSEIYSLSGAMYVEQLIAYVKLSENISFVFGTTLGEINEDIAKKYVAADNLSGATVPADEISGSITLIATGTYPTVGSYSVDISALISSNYDVRAAAEGVGTVEITRRKVTVTLDESDTNLSRIYGEDEYDIAVQSIENTVEGFDVTGKPQRASGNTVGEYPINIGTLANDNYTVVLDKDYYYAITPRPIVVVPVETGNVYGQSAKTITYSTYFKGNPEKTGLLSGDSLSGALSRENAEISDAGTYIITIGTLNPDDSPVRNINYTVELDDSRTYYYTIDVATVTVFANAVSREFGNVSQSSLSLTYSASGLVGSDKLAGSLALESPVYDESGYLMPGTYTIIQGNIFNKNYTVVYHSNSYTVVRRNLTYYVEYNTLSYGSFEYEAGSALAIGTDGFDAALTGGLVEGHDFAPEVKLNLGSASDGVLNAGTYQYIYSYDGTDYYNGQKIVTDVYSVTVGNSTGEFVVSPAKLQLAIYINGVEYVVGNAAETVKNVSLTYNGEKVLIETALLDSDFRPVDIDYSASLTKQIDISGKYFAVDDMTDVGYYRLIGKIDSLSDPNYQVTGKGSGSSVDVLLTLNIEKFKIALDVAEMLAGKLEKTYGDPDPDLTAVYQGFNGENIAIVFERATGKNTGKYPIASASIADEIYAENYSVSVINAAEFSITPRPLILDAETLLAGRLEKTYGDPDPDFTAAATGVSSETVSVVFVRASGENAGEYVFESVRITSENAANYSVSIASETRFRIDPKSAVIRAEAENTVFRGSAFSLEELTLTFVAEGFINGDENAVSGSLTVVGEILHAGTYEIVCAEEFTHPDYDITYESAFVTVAPASVTVESYNLSGNAFDYDPSVGAVGSENFGYRVISGTVYTGYELNGSLGDVLMTAGEHDIPQGTLTEEYNPDYMISYVAGKVIINYVELVVKAESATQIYGEAPTAIKFEVERKDGKIFDLEINGGLGFRMTLGAHSPVGTYQITLGTLEQENPNFKFELFDNGATYVIVPRPLTIIPSDVTAVYGEPEKALGYTLGGEYGLADGDSLNITLSRKTGTDAGKYIISVSEGYAENNPDYEINVGSGVYTITPRPVMVALRDQSQEFNMSGIYTVDQTAYDLTEGTVIAGDDLGVVIVKADGTAMGLYTLTAYSLNPNYTMTYEEARFEIRKFAAVITVESAQIEMVYSGASYSIKAEVNSGASVAYSYDYNGETLNANSFTEIGRYVVTLTAPETDFYYAPEPVTVYLTINKEVLTADNSGIDVIVNNGNGFAPEIELDLEKMDQDDRELNEVLSSNESVVRAFNISAVSESGEATLGEAPSITVKVPEALKDMETVKVLIKENGAYSVRLLNVSDDGYVTIEGVINISAFAFVKEESSDGWLLLLLIGAAVLIVIVSATVFVLRKRG